MMKIAAVCSSGLGSSFMVEMNMQEVLKDLGVADKVEATHMDMGGAEVNDADQFFVGKDLADAAENQFGDKVTVLNSLIDKDELKEKIRIFLQEQGILD
ncbi:PTS sugar transporter subunit IIB [Tetragenococcus solitarius]|uniref:PTS sugar transporter subunit IIB n=2 Tax=Tetragenococcus solitarius TaxID=71453 RepID=A0ABN3Y4R1_9ENTE